MKENKDSIEIILDEVHNSEEIKKCRHSKSVVYENSFVLTKAEAYEGLKSSGTTKTEIKRSIIYTVFLMLAIAGFIFAYFVKKDVNSIVFAVISIIMLAVVWIVPIVDISGLAKKNANGKTIKFQIYQSHMHIICEENKWCIHLDNSNKMKICKKVIIIKRTKDNQVFVIPIRAIERAKREKVICLLENGMLNLKN